VIIAAALCPAAPLLIRELTGADPVVPELRRACLDAVAELHACDPDVVAVIGASGQTRAWGDDARFDLADFAPGIDLHRARASSLPNGPRSPAELPLPLGIGAWLLDQAGSRARRALRSVAQDEPATRCAAVGAGLAAAPERTAVLVMADGSARRGPKAPGYLDERSAAFDAEVERAIRAADLDALLRVDEHLARELMAAGRPAWQVLAGALHGSLVATQVRYCDDPFGVAYLVASLRLSGDSRGSAPEGNAPEGNAAEGNAPEGNTVQRDGHDITT